MPGQTTHLLTQGSRLELDLRHHDPIPHFVGETWSIKEVGAPKFGRIRGPTELDWHTTNWFGTQIRIPSNLFFVFVAYFIRAYLRGASFGSRLIGETHGHIIIMVMARVN